MNAGKHHRPARDALILGLWIALAFAAAWIGSRFSPGDWYAGLRKPTWNPPNWIFAPVWTTLYAMMGIAAWLVWKRGGLRVQRMPLALYLMQLTFNAFWSPLFFGLKSPGLAFVDIVLLWITLLATLLAFWKARPVAGILLLPYLAWVTFAGTLNFTIWQMN